MPLSEADRAFLKQLYKNLADTPLKPGSKFYEPVYQELPLDDPVQQLSTLIDFDGIESIHLFSGFRGSGKTTELLRLCQDLEDRRYFVLYADALDYVNAAEPIEITDLLIVLAGAFSDALEDKLGKDIARETFWDRLVRFLDAEVHVKEASAKAELQSPESKLLGGIKTGVDLKFEIKSATSFRQTLQAVLSKRLQTFKASVDKFFEDGVKLIHNKHGDETQIVFIFDQLEQLRGTLQTEQDVIRSVERIFSIHIDLLKIPYMHMIFTAPPWLKFVLPGTTKVTLLSTVHLWNKDPERSRCEPTWSVFRSLVKRRLGEEGLLRLFGPPPAQQERVDRLIDVCGGHFRDLLRLLRDTVVRATSLPALPVSDAVLDHAVNSARRDFLPIAADDAQWLAKIAAVRATALPNTEATAVNRLARFLDSHFVLYFVNGDEWYDIHPLIRDEVAEVIKATPLAPTP